MTETSQPGAPVLRCAQCGTPIARVGDGLYAILPPSPPRAGYLEAIVIHQHCAVEFEEAYGSVVAWRPLVQLWRGGDAGS